MSDQGYGFLTPNAQNSELGVIEFVVRRMVAEMSTSKLVRVTAVTGGGLDGAGTVDVLPLVQQVDGNGYGTPHGIVPGLPWSRLQGGANAIICDPEVDDIGYVVAMDRDTSRVRATRDAALPGTGRQFDIADGIYAGSCLAVTPDQYVIFTADGIRVVDRNGNSVSLGSTGMTLQDLNGNKIIMAAGFVNIVTTVFQVNGVPVTVP